MPLLKLGLRILLGSLSVLAPLPAQTSKPVRAIAVKPAAQVDTQGEKRVALVIGNAAYKDAPLRNPVNDVQAMANAMKACGFTVIKLENATRSQMREAIRTFGAKIAEGGVGLFYFAGHGMQVKGRNFLIPVGADITQEDEVEGEAVEVDAVLAKMETARNRLNIMILDACRNNPFGRSFRSSQQGLAQMDAPAGTYVAFATSPGRTAADGNGSNGMYTHALLQHLKIPGLRLEDVFKRTRAQVLQASEQKQTPWENSSIVGDFYFVPGNTPASGLSATLEELPPPPIAAPEVGGLQIVVNAFNTQVYVDGKFKGKASPTSALNIRDLPVGSVTVRVEALGHQMQEKPFEIQQGRWTRAKLVLVKTPSPMPTRVRPQEALPKSSAATASAPLGGDVIATLGGKAISFADFYIWLKVMVGPRAESIQENATKRNQSVKQYLELQVLAAKGQKENLQNTKEFQATMGALKMQCYARVLLDEERPGGDAQKIKELAENPTEAEVKAFFEANKDRYATPERFTARHILVGLKGAPGIADKGLTEEEAKAKLAMILAELRAGKKLEDLAKDYSDDPSSKNNGGLYKDIPYGRFAKEFEGAVRTQELGKVGEPVKTSFGYHLIQVESRSPKQEGDFEKIKDTLRKQMGPERREKLTRELIEQAKRDVSFREGSVLQASANSEPFDGDSIAYLGTKKITYSDFSRWLRVMAGSRAESLRKNPASRSQAQKQYLELQVLAAKGQKENLQNTKEFQATMGALKMQCYARVLLDEERPGGDAQKIKELAENPTEAEVKAFFEANKDRYEFSGKPAEYYKVKNTVRDQMIPERREKLTREFVEKAKQDMGFKESLAD